MAPSRDAVLLVTVSYDQTAETVERALRSAGARPFRLNTDEFPASVEATLDERGEFVLYAGGGEISSREVRAVWYRRHSSPNLPDDLDADYREFAERESRAFLTGTVLCLGDDVRWVSHPTALWSAEKKPFQLRVAAALGLRIPMTRITNRPADVQVLAQRGPLVAKAVSSGYILRGHRFDAIFTSEVGATDLIDLSSLNLAPVTFQEQVAKRSDVRVTVVGSRIFAAEILSQEHPSSRVDWRATELADLPHRALELPAQLEQKCHELLSTLRLRFGAIDLIRTDDDTYWFLEINPNGEWLWIEHALGYPIAAAIASELLG